MSDEYNGWPNRETWAVNMHWGNDQGLYESMTELIRRCQRRGETVSVVADSFREEVSGLLNPSVYRDIFGTQQPEGLASIAHEVGSLSRVDWRCLAEAWMEDTEDES